MTQPSRASFPWSLQAPIYAVAFFTGNLLAGPNLVDDLGGRLGEEPRVVELAGGARQFFLRGGQLLLQPPSLGRQVDGPRCVEFDNDGGCRQPHLQRRRRGEDIGRRGQPGQGSDRPNMRVEVVFISTTATISRTCATDQERVRPASFIRARATAHVRAMMGSVR